MAGRRHVPVTPSAARLTGSLRDIGYDFPSAIADLVDNSIAAGATLVAVDIEFDGRDSRVTIADDGSGMTANGINEALRFGSRRDYALGDLGRYGLGLKTASLSQCRSVTVLSRRPNVARTSVRQLNLDVIAEWDDWLIIDPGNTPSVRRARQLLDRGFNTVVIWDALDRVLPENRPEGGWARRRFQTLAARTAQHLGMVFHHYIETDSKYPSVTIVVNGEKLSPWNPFAPDEPATEALPSLEFEVTIGATSGRVRFERFVLPTRDAFSSGDEFERMSGPQKWNRQQGLYIYRAGRLVQSGGWAGIRAVDEHTKLARGGLYFDTDLDSAFNINVAKMRVSLPPQLRQVIERPIHEVCSRADNAYRKHSARRPSHKGAPRAGGDGNPELARTAGLALRSAALQTGDYEALRRIAHVAESQSPGLLASVGLSDL